jgi:hypothetical protein
MAMGMPYGLQSMLKEGHKFFSGVDEAVIKNIEACKGLAQITRTSLGPNGGRERTWGKIINGCAWAKGARGWSAAASPPQMIWSAASPIFPIQA